MPPSKENRVRHPERVPAGPSTNPRPGGAMKVAVANSTEATLARVLHLAETLMRDNRDSRGTLPSGRTAPAGAESAQNLGPDGMKTHAREQLVAELRGLGPEMAIKLRTLMIAGRDGQSIDLVKVNLSLADADAGFAIMADDSSENGPLLVDYLRRGHALACASGIDLDGPLTRWQSRALDLGERAWLSFGKQLAGSQPGDWQCLGLVEQPTRELSKLYLRLREHGWWSFRVVLDRPTPAGVEKERRELAKRRLEGVSANTLEAIVGRFAGVQGRALQRAGRAICARLGHVAA